MTNLGIEIQILFVHPSPSFQELKSAVQKYPEKIPSMDVRSPFGCIVLYLLIDIGWSCLEPPEPINVYYLCIVRAIITSFALLLFLF